MAPIEVIPAPDGWMACDDGQVSTNRASMAIARRTGDRRIGGGRGEMVRDGASGLLASIERLEAGGGTVRDLTE